MADETIPTSPHQGGCKPAWRPPSPVELQGQLLQYKVLDLLGHGGMGAVYKGWQVSLDRYVAIKILPPDIEDGDAHFAARFKQEAKTMARFQHPGIVSVYDAGETASGLLYIVMEFVEGTDVAQMVKANGRLPPENALAITAHVCDALHYAHTHGVVHRDIKPANIMVNHEGEVKVADFGLAKANEAAYHGLTRTDMSMGTPDYIAPEALMLGVVADHRADLYAVGVMLYNMLTGDIPRGKFKMPSQKVGTDPRFDAIVDKAMEQERDQRYQTAQEIRRDLDVILTTPMEKAAPEPPPAASQPTLLLPKSATTGAPPAPAASSKSPPQRGAKVSTAGVSPALPGKKFPAIISTALVGGIAIISLGAFFAFKKPSSSSGSRIPPPAITATNEVWHDGLPEIRGFTGNSTRLLKEGHDWRVAEPTAGGRFYTGVGAYTMEDMAVRVTYLPADGIDREVHLSVRDSGKASLRVVRHSGASGEWSLESVASNKPSELLTMPLTGQMKANGERTIELRVTGSVLSFFFNGTLAGQVPDLPPASGRIGINCTVGVILKKVEWSDLGATPVQAPASATKDVPFVNSQAPLLRVFNSNDSPSPPRAP